MIEGKNTMARREVDHQTRAREGEIIRRCRNGEREAFNELIKLYESRVYNFAFRLTGRYDEANDVASETFIRLYNSIGSFRGDSSFITWLFRIATNVYLDERKRMRSRPTESLNDVMELEENAVAKQLEDKGPRPHDIAVLNERNAILQKAISGLPEYQRMMIVLYHTEGQSYEQIAEALDMPIGTVKSRLNRARLALRDLLQPAQEHFRI